AAPSAGRLNQTQQFSDVSRFFSPYLELSVGWQQTPQGDQEPARWAVGRHGTTEGVHRTMPTTPPIFVADLFPEVTGCLLELLRSLSPDEWRLATVSSRRTVKDVASHLLDGSLRRLSMQRDGYLPDDARGGSRAGEPLMGFLNRLNDEWEA